MNLGVRVVLAFVLIAAAPAATVTAASARPRAQVPAFTVSKGDEALAYFGPEVARAVGAALDTRGVAVGAGGELSVTGRVDELTGERVRLTATARGRTVTADGPLESIDAVAGELAARLAPILLEGANGASKPVTVKDGGTRLARLNDLPPPKGTAGSGASASPATSREAAATAAPAAKDPVKDATPPAKDPPPPAAPTATTPAPKPDTVTPGTTPPHPGPTTVTTPARPTVSDDDEDLPPRTQAPGAGVHYAPPPYGYARGRVVAHAIADVPNAFAGTGASATQALYYFLRLRMHLSVVPTGIGMAPPQLATDEGWRAGARAIIMVRLANVEYLPAPGGTSVRLRLEVAVVRDGRIVLRRAIQSSPTDPGPAGLRRGREMDPIFQAVTQSLEAILHDLNSALIDIR